MIVGSVRNNAPRVTLMVYGQAGQQEVEFVLDTGYTGELAMPALLLQTIGASVRGRGFIALADGTDRSCVLCSVQVQWDDKPRLCQALSLDGDPLIGMTFLHDNQVYVEVTEGGEVTIEPL